MTNSDSKDPVVHAMESASHSLASTASSTDMRTVLILVDIESKILSDGNKRSTDKTLEALVSIR